MNLLPAKHYYAAVADLTKQQIRFLDYHNIAIDEAYDASGLKRAEYGQRMRSEGKFVAYGVTHCLNGHSLRTRSGNCVQCRPAAIAYGRRSALPGYVYIACSRATKLTKVGFSGDDPDNRIYIANLEGYGGVRDWRIRARIWSERAGMLELATHRALAPRRLEQLWVRNGCDIVTKELFACSYTHAARVLRSLLSPHERWT